MSDLAHMFPELNENQLRMLQRHIENIIGDESLNAHVTDYFQRNLLSYEEAQHAIKIRQQLREEQRKRAGL